MTTELIHEVIIIISISVTKDLSEAIVKMPRGQYVVIVTCVQALTQDTVTTTDKMATEMETVATMVPGEVPGEV